MPREIPPVIDHEHPAPSHFTKPIELRVTIPRTGGNRLKDDMKLAQWCERVLRTRLHTPGLEVALIVSGEGTSEQVRECTRLPHQGPTHLGPCNGWPREHGCPIHDPLPWENERDVQQRRAELTGE